MSNYNLKNIMLGIGIGLVFSSMINISTGGRELTAEEIKKEAVKHDLIVLSKEDILNSQGPEDVQPLSPTPASQPVPDKIEIEVESGMSSEIIADLLKEKGAIDDTKAFLIRLEELKKAEKLKVGRYKIPAGSSYDDIIIMMTK